MKPIDPDLELIAQAKKELPNRTHAYEILMRRHEKLLYRVCFRIMGNPSDAEDAFQEVMVKVYNSIPKFEQRASFKTWLFKITHNTCYTAITRLVKAREFQSVLDNDIQDIHIENTLDAELDSERILLSLPPQDRELLTLKYVVELSFDEIAQVFDMGVSAVKMRVYRAVELLKEKHKLN